MIYIVKFSGDHRFSKIAPKILLLLCTKYHLPVICTKYHYCQICTKYHLPVICYHTCHCTKYRLPVTKYHLPVISYFQTKFVSNY